MLTIKADTVVYAMSAANLPVATIRSGDTVQFETLDCFGGQIRRENQLLGGINFSNINPATGPIYVEEALPGDLLKVEIHSIDISKQAIMTNSPGHGVFGDRIGEERTKLLKLGEGEVWFHDQIRLPARPMIGVIGTAPAEAAIETGTPGPHGGNMDCNRIVAGSVLYLPVAVQGALLAMGDLHAVMGDGEVSVCGAETPGCVTARISVYNGEPLPTPFLISGADAMTIFSAATLEEAARGATLAMQELMVNRLPLDFHEAGMLLSLAGNLRICQVVDPLVTCRMELPLQIFHDCGVAL